MRTVVEVAALSAAVAEHRAAGRRVGFVPTMGFLHSGHASLMALMRPQCDVLVTSIYVNPLQFGPNEDLARYPRDPVGDAALCEAQGVDLLFMPETLYPEGMATTVSVRGLTEGLCGASRPGHFDGVATVVTRLFSLVQCQAAVFGEKDWQQLAVIRRVVRDLGLPVEVIGAPLVRADDGLALSSRNTYLDAEQRRRALSLSRALFAMRDAARAGQTGVPSLLALGRSMLDVDREDYLEIVDGDSLQPLAVVGPGARFLVAAVLGKTRLIDNVGL